MEMNGGRMSFSNFCSYQTEFDTRTSTCLFTAYSLEILSKNLPQAAGSAGRPSVVRISSAVLSFAPQ